MKTPTLSEQERLPYLVQEEIQPSREQALTSEEDSPAIALEVDSEMPVKQKVPEGPATLPSHILAVGDHHRLAPTSSWWIGDACPAYEEVQHLQGIVIYNRSTSIFLTQAEAAEAQKTLLTLMP